jgi:hypothetical protein
MHSEDIQILKENFLKASNSLRSANINLIDELTKDANLANKRIPKDEALHFPQNDVIDSQTGCQYFMHRHSSEYAEDSVHIHFFKRWRPAELNLPKGNTIPTHLAALEISSVGKPLGWFTLNQWVLGDYWQAADATIALFDDWAIRNPDSGRGDSMNPISHEWLVALIQLNLHGTIRDLLEERDQKLDTMVDQKPNKNVLEDRTIEIFGYKSIN